MNLIYVDADHVSEFDRDELKSISLECEIEVIEAEYNFNIQCYRCKRGKRQRNSLIFLILD